MSRKQIPRNGTDDDLEMMVNKLQDWLHHVEQGVLQLLGGKHQVPVDIEFTPDSINTLD